MGFENLATKDDLKKLEDKISSLLASSPKESPQGMKMSDVCKTLGGVSPSLINTLRVKGELTARKVGDRWIFNRQQVLDYIPKYKPKQL